MMTMASVKTTPAAAATDGTGSTISDQLSPSAPRRPGRRRRHRPWQVDWKDPQWTIQKQQHEQQQQQPQDTKDGRRDDDENLVIVNAASCLVSKHEIPQYIMDEINNKNNNDNNNNNDGQQQHQQQNEDSTAADEDEGEWILSVRLLAAAATATATTTTPSSHAYDQASTNLDHDRNFDFHVATHVQIEILRMTMDSTATSTSSSSSTSSNDDETTNIIVDDGKRRQLKVLFQKQLQWPETIDNDNVGGVKDKERRKSRGTQHRKKNKNWFISKVWKPLLGEIDEDERSNDHQKDNTEAAAVAIQKAEAPGQQQQQQQQEEEKDEEHQDDDDDNLHSEGEAEQNSTSPMPIGGIGNNDPQASAAASASEVSISIGAVAVAKAYEDGIGDDGTSTLDDGGSHISNDDEDEDDDEIDDDDLFRRFDMDSLLSTKGIISATFCRRPKHIQDHDQDTPTGDAAAERSEVIDTIQMMNLGISSSNQSSAGSSSQSTTGTVLKNDGGSKKGGVSPSATSKEEYDIHLICMNHVGNVFVYNPWDLLLPPKPKLRSQQSQHNDDGDDFAQLLFGQTLFDTLQQTWKPLSEPISTIEPAVFASSTKTLPPPPGRDNAIGVVESSGLQLPSTISHSNIHNINPEYQAGDGDDGKEHEKQQAGLDGSITSDRKSVRSDHSGRTETTSGSHHQRRHDKRRNRRLHQRHRKQHRRNASPFFLWNPTFDASTIKDATTINNRPISIHPAGAAYIVILGQGIHHFKKSSRRNDVSMDDGDETNEGLHSIASGSSDEQEWWLKSSDRDPSRNESGTLKRNFRHNDALGQTTDKDEGKSTTSGSTISHVRRRMNARYRSGGFLTFVSTAHWSETRTLFLPFVPVSTSFISEWMGAEWFLVTGTTQAVLVRINAIARGIASYGGDRTTVPIGPAPSSLILTDMTLGNSFGYSEREDADFAHRIRTSSTSSKRNSTEDDDERERLTIRKFQMLPIDVNVSGSIVPRLISGSGSRVEPPSLLELYVEDDTTRQRALVLLKSFSHCTPKGTIALTHHPKDIAKIVSQRADDGNSKINSMDSYDLRWWSQHGQGWSLVGTSKQIFFICWEGSTLASGAYVTEISPALHGQCPVLCQDIMALPKTSTILNPISSDESPQMMSAISNIQFSTPIEDVIGSQNARKSQIVNVPRDLILEATNSLYQAFMDTEEESTELSPKRKSEILLQHCASWTQLEEKVEDRISLQNQFPLLTLHTGPAHSPHSIFSIRKLVEMNGVVSPFQQVLAWLAQRGDYFDAASLALDLLNDSECLFHLWRYADMIDESDESSKLEGLLDGIAEVKLVDPTEDEADVPGSDVHLLSTSHLADMTIGCMIKGGYSMSRTLRLFLTSNSSYNPSRACLMLAATTASVISVGPSQTKFMTKETSEQPEDDEILWPIQCLLDIGTSRDYMETALRLLNVTIPEELRNRADLNYKNQYYPSLDGIELTQKIVELVVASDNTAQDILFDLEDPKTSHRYWESLDQETCLAIALIKIDSLYPLLRNSEVRRWIRDQLDADITNDARQPFQLSSAWLKHLCGACLVDAGCEISTLQVNDHSEKPLNETLDDRDDDDGLKKLKLETEETRDALSGLAIDFDILITGLLLLDVRKECWIVDDHQYVSTQCLLNTICFMAGRRADDYTFLDGPSCMKYCFLANNVEAGANLIGGKNGFILHCSNMLTKELNIPMPEAENIIVSDQLDLNSIMNFEETSFELNDSHRKLLLLLDEHVLTLQKFGEFDTVHSRGRVDPVFVARSVFRTWLAITYGDLVSATEYLDSWLSRRLDIADDGDRTKIFNSSVVGSSHRLACAALAQALIFSSAQLVDTTTSMDDSHIEEDPSSKKTLAEALGMKKRLVIDICQSCCGIVHSVRIDDLAIQ